MAASGSWHVECRFFLHGDGCIFVCPDLENDRVRSLGCRPVLDRSHRQKILIGGAWHLDGLGTDEADPFDAAARHRVPTRRLVGIHDTQVVNVLDPFIVRFLVERGPVADDVDLEWNARHQTPDRRRHDQ